MGYKDVTSGDKTAKLKGARFIKSPAKGTPGIELAFEFIEPSTGTPERLNYVAWLSAGALGYSMEMLTKVLGYNGSEETDFNGVLTDPKAFNYGQEVKLVVEEESYVNSAGEQKSAMKIKYVNSLGGSQFANVEPKTIKADLASVGFRAAFLAAKQQSPKQQDQPPAFVADEKLAF